VAAWRQRHSAGVIATIADLHADVLCLQEFWFAPAFLQLYTTGLARLG